MWLPTLFALALASLCTRQVWASSEASPTDEVEPFVLETRGFCQIEGGERESCVIKYTKYGCQLVSEDGRVLMAYTQLSCSEAQKDALGGCVSKIAGLEGTFNIESGECMTIAVKLSHD